MQRLESSPFLPCVLQVPRMLVINFKLHLTSWLLFCSCCVDALAYRALPILHSILHLGVSSFWETPFCISISIVELITNSLSFGVKCILPSTLKDIFGGYRILCWEIFSFSTLKISSHCLLFKFPVEKSADGLSVLLKVIYLFSSGGFEGCSLSLCCSAVWLWCA